MAGRDLSAELFGDSAKPVVGRDLSEELFGAKPKDEGFLSNIAKLALEGGERAIGAARVSPSVISGGVGPEQAALISEQLGMKPTVQPKELTEVTTAFKDEAEALKKAQGFTESIGPVFQFMGELGKQALTNPKGVAYLTAQSAANMAPSIAGMIAGGKLGAMAGTAVTPGLGTAIGGVGGAIAGGFAGEAPMEIGAEFIDNVGKELRSRGLEPTKENVESLLSDKDFVQKAVGEARTKGTTTAAVDALMTAGAGRYATGPRRAAIKAAQTELGAAADAAAVASRAKEILKEGTKAERAGRAIKRGAGAVGIDVAGGGLSEAAGQYAAYGEVDPESIALEMLGELGGAGIEVPSAAYATGRDALKAQARKQAEQILEQERAAAPEKTLEEVEREAGMAAPAVEPTTPEAEQARRAGLVGAAEDPLAAAMRARREQEEAKAEVPLGRNYEFLQREKQRLMQAEQTPEVRAELDRVNAQIQSVLEQNIADAQRAKESVFGQAELPPVESRAAVVAERELEAERTPVREEVPVGKKEAASLAQLEAARGTPAPKTEEQVRLEEAEAARRKFEREQYKGNLLETIGKSLSLPEIEDIGVDVKGVRRIAAEQGKKGTEISELIADGMLDNFLPPNERVGGSAFDPQSSAEKIKDKIRTGDLKPFEAETEMRRLEGEVAAAEREYKAPIEVQRAVSEATAEERAAKAEAMAAPAVPELDALRAQAEEAGVDVSAISEQAYEESRDNPEVPYETALAERLSEALGVERTFQKEAPQEVTREAEKGKTGYSPEPEHQRVEKELTGKTMLQVADWAVNNAPNAFYKTIAEKVRNRLRELERKGVEFSFKVEGGDRRSSKMSSSRGIAEYKWGDEKENTKTQISVTLNGAAVMDNQAGYPPGVKYDTVLHELLHVATRAYLRFAPLTDSVRSQMRELTNAVVDRFNADAKAGKLPPVMERYYKRLNNVLESDDEVMAWGLTDGDVQKYYADIKVGEKSAMTRLVELVRNVLGLGKQYESALDRLVKVSESMLDMDIDAVEKVVGAAGKRLGAPRPTAGVQETLFQKEGRKPQTETAEFKRWFGKSVLTDDNGKPMVMYHQTKGNFSEFIPGGINPKVSGPAIWMRPDPSKMMSGHITGTRRPGQFQEGSQDMPLYARLENALGSTDTNWKEVYGQFAEKGNSPWIMTPEFVAELKKAGYDGIMHFDKNGVLQEAAVFDPKQVKSAIGNIGTFSPETADITRQQEGRENVLGQKVLGTWTEPTETKMAGELGKDDIIYWLQDKMVDTKRVVQAITAQAGKIASRWNPYLQEELYHGRTAKQTQDFLTKELRPLMQEMQKNGVTIGEFEQYLHNRHAEEYNKQVAKVNPDDPEMQDGGSGITTEDARKYLADLPADKKKLYESLADRIDSITKGTRNLLVKSGLESKETIDAWEKAFPDYVPLHREDVDFQYTTSSTGTGQGFDVRGPFSRRAMGSKRNVVDILANIAMQRERAIVKAEKNRVAEAVYGLALQNPNPDFWLAVNPMAEKVPEAALEELRAMGIDEDAVKFLMKEPRQRSVDPKKNEVVSRINTVLRNNDNVLSMRFNGENRYVFFNPNNERSARAAKALKNLDAEQLSQVMGMISKITRWMASVNTQYNPIFGAYNFLRDVQGAALQLSDTPLAGKQKEVAANVLPSLKAIYASIRKGRKGEEVDTEMAKLWADFQKAGGQTGFRDMFSRSQERAEALQKEFLQMTEGKLKSAGRATLDWLSDYNDTMENAVRLAAYKVALDGGMNRDEAASLAKNLTVNFNKKGQVATQAGALYAFFNAAVQGTTRLAQTLKGPAGKKIMAGGALLGVMQAALLAMAGFDEEEPPEFVRERNIVIPIGKDKYVTFPMPLGYHVIPGTTRILTEWALGGFKDTPEKIASLTGMYLEAFNPIGNAGWSVQSIAPTFADPLVALAENKDWTGKPIARKDFSNLDPTPGYTRAKDTASWISTQIAKFLNYASGGTKYQPGVISPTPDQIDYLIGQATGGLGREALKAATTVEKTATGEELPPYKIPVVGRFYGETKSSAAESNRFYKNLEHLNKLENEIKGRRENREPVGAFLADNPEARLAKRANEIYSDIKKLRDRKEKLVERDAPRESVKAVENQITMKMRMLNEQVERAKK